MTNQYSAPASCGVFCDLPERDNDRVMCANGRDAFRVDALVAYPWEQTAQRTHDDVGLPT